MDIELGMQCQKGRLFDASAGTIRTAPRRYVTRMRHRLSWLLNVERSTSWKPFSICRSCCVSCLHIFHPAIQEEFSFSSGVQLLARYTDLSQPSLSIAPDQLFRTSLPLRSTTSESSPQTPLPVWYGLSLPRSHFLPPQL